MNNIKINTRISSYEWCVNFSENGTHWHNYFNKITNIKLYKNSSGMYCLLPRGQTGGVNTANSLFSLSDWAYNSEHCRLVKAFKFIVTLKVQNSIVCAPPYKMKVIQHLFLTDLETSMESICYSYWMTNWSKSVAWIPT